MPRNIEIVHLNYPDDKVFIYTPPAGQSIDSNLRRFLINHTNKLTSNFIKKAKIIRNLQYSDGEDQSDK
eukprot:3393461-Ditylum_brightwellii.AAC.1